MLSLAVKYRPKKFEEVLEQKSIKLILQEQLKTGTQKNCYLFTGGAGTGKTTCARIFANEINAGKGNPIEIDAASNNGVDNVREIIDNAKFKAIDAPFKVYIIDECFAGDTPVQLQNGECCPIKDIRIGDHVNNMLGGGVVKNVFKNLISLDRLCIISLTDGSQMLTTAEHLFFTNNGWVEAKNLSEEDILYNGTEVSELWKSIPLEEIPQELRQRMYDSPYIQERVQNDEFGTRASAEVGEFSENAKEQSHAPTRNCRENGSDQETKRYLASGTSDTGWERDIYCCSTQAVSTSAERLDFRVRNSYKNAEGEWVPNVLQSRPRLSYNKAGDRGGWEEPSLENLFISGCKKRGSVGEVRVAGVTLYERGNNEQYFSSFIGDTEKSTGFITLYDLEVSGHSSYIANNILVHNCHMLSTGAWNAMLKLLEEPPAQTIFVMCTTDPQKIPATILSRVQRYDFQRISYAGIVQRLNYIVEQEGLEAEPEAIEYIAKLADGGCRDSITLLDKCIGYDQHLTISSVIEALGTIDYETMFRLTGYLLNYKIGDAIKLVEEVYRSGADLKQFMKQYSYFLIDAYKYYLLQGTEYIQIPPLYEDDLAGFSDEEFESIRNLLTRIVALNADIKWEQAPKAFIEATFIILGGE